ALGDHGRLRWRSNEEPMQFHANENSHPPSYPAEAANASSCIKNDITESMMTVPVLDLGLQRGVPWEKLFMQMSISGRRKRLLSGPRRYCLAGPCTTFRWLKGANHEIQLPGLRGREAVGRDVRERARSHNRGVFCLRRHPAPRRSLDGSRRGSAKQPSCQNAEVEGRKNDRYRRSLR